MQTAFNIAQALGGMAASSIKGYLVAVLGSRGTMMSNVFCAALQMQVQPVEPCCKKWCVIVVVQGFDQCIQAFKEVRFPRPYMQASMPTC